MYFVVSDEFVVITSSVITDVTIRLINSREAIFFGFLFFHIWNRTVMDVILNYQADLNEMAYVFSSNGFYSSCHNLMLKFGRFLSSF